MVKRFLWIPLFLLLPFLVFAQKKEKEKIKVIEVEEVPMAVTSAIMEDFPNGKVKSFERIPQDIYIVDWGNDAIYTARGAAPDLYRVRMKDRFDKRELIYNERGKLLWSAQKDKFHELPNAVNQTVSQMYGDGVIYKNKHYVNPKGDMLDYYKVKMKTDAGKHHTVWVDQYGNVLD